MKASRDLQFWNGLGGFTPDGREYVIQVAPESDGHPRLPPAPWINVVANPNCGFLISESGGGYSWAGNSQGNRLTPWNNDPVSDPSGEVVYIRDNATGEVWSPTPLPSGGGATTVRHGQGYSVFEQQCRDLAHAVLLFVPPEDPVKIVRLRIRNFGAATRRLTVVRYIEWVLGTLRENAPHQVVTAFDEASNAVFATNAWAGDSAGHVAFAAAGEPVDSFTADRADFLGQYGSPRDPAGLRQPSLAGCVGAALDPCAALAISCEIPAGGTKEVVFFLGQESTADRCRELISKYRKSGAVDAALAAACKHWDDVLEHVHVNTPDPAFNLMLNRWLLYQAHACRLWGRSAFYQSGGAYGFRDQLQDVMALVYSAADETRAQILRAAARQFREGDVQHWWHPPSGRGVRTHICDDLLWLPLVVCHYVEATGDASILAEHAPFIAAAELKPGQEDDYGQPEVTTETATVYEHCVRTLERGHRLGPHGLPLMGAGDWNDGMNKIGVGGKGESVWMGWFLHSVLARFADLAERQGDAARAGWCRERASALSKAVEAHAWDGAWYRRAYFDDGTPLGTAANDECKIDSIAQSWAVISGAADPDRAKQAMQSVEKYLVRDADRMILLFDPPFDKGKLEPGYIKGYVPGIRENGGQYTHAATWVVLATALSGRGTRAVELFSMLNPVSHARTPEEVEHYKVEPYVVAADVYGAPPHTGRGGWTWYTGSASWLYRVGLEGILGFQLCGNLLRIDPCIAANWPGFDLRYRFKSATYHLHVVNPRGVERGVERVTVDGVVSPDRSIKLLDDGKEHRVEVELG